MKKSDLFPSQYFKSEDIRGKTVKVKIKNVVREEVGPDKDVKNVIIFSNTDKKLVMNFTNYERIADYHGGETDDWKGKVIKLRVERVAFGSKTVDGIRVVPKPPEEPEEGLEFEPDDDDPDDDDPDDDIGDVLAD